MHRDPARQGVTLVELMIALAIVGVLAAIAIPRFQDARNRSRRAEVVTNLRGIGVSAHGAFTTGNDQEFDGAGPQPRADAALDKRAVPWVSDAGFDFLGFAPDGHVRCNYTVDVSDPDDMFVRGACDIDVVAVLAEARLEPGSGVELLTGEDVY